jgi:hypothetical protein
MPPSHPLQASVQPYRLSFGEKGAQGSFPRSPYQNFQASFAASSCTVWLLSKSAL